MKAIVQTAYGAPDDVLEVREVAEPVAGDGEVLVRVHAASLHPDVWHTVTGRPYVLRIMGSGLRTPQHGIPGIDLAGHIEAVGANVTTFQLGDEVFGEIVSGNQWRNGGAFAEYVAVPADALALKPATLSSEQAAAIPTSAFIALRGLRHEGRIRAGQNVLINGAGGGVGVFAVQLAKAYGASVTAVDNGAKSDMLRAIGADRVIDYEEEDFTRGGERYDLILDVAGNHPWKDCERAVAPDGTYVLIGHDHYGASGGRWIGSIGRFIGLLVRSTFDHRLPGRHSFKAPDYDPMTVVLGFIADGKITPVIDRTFPLEETHAAMRHMQSGQVQGKIVLTV